MATAPVVRRSSGNRLSDDVGRRCVVAEEPVDGWPAFGPEPDEDSVVADLALSAGNPQPVSTAAPQELDGGADGRGEEDQAQRRDDDDVDEAGR